MSCNSALYCANTSKQPFVEGGTIPFGSIVRRFGGNVQLDGQNIMLMGSGYYDVEVSATLSPSATGDIAVQLYQDGVAVPGATASATIAAANDFCNLDISCLVRNCGCNCNSVLSLGVDGAGTLENMATVVKKV